MGGTKLNCGILSVLALTAAFCGAGASASGTDGPLILAVPTFGDETLLLNDQGKVEKVWKSAHQNAGGARLLPDGSLLHVVSMPLEPSFRGAGVTGGGIEMLTGSGEARWQFWNSTTHHITYGDALVLPNGNVLTAVLEWKSREDAEKAGRDPAQLDEKGLLVPGLMEFRPQGQSAGIPVWRWSLWDHLCQGRHPALKNYAFPQPKAGCVDINTFAKKSRRWLTPNQLDYDEGSDLIVVTIRELGEAWIIDHSTTTASASTDAGGNEESGGRILSRLGAAGDHNEQRQILVANSWNRHSESETDVGLNLLRYDGAVLRAQRGGRREPFGLVPAPSSRIVGEGSKTNWLKDGMVVPGGGGVFTSGVADTIVRTSSEGEALWTFQNTHGKMRFVPRGGGEDGGSCCGGGGSKREKKAHAKGGDPKAAPDTLPQAIEAAPIKRLRAYPAGYLTSN